MIRQLWVYETDCVNPYHNLALEAHLLTVLPKDSMLLFLWQNQKTVVIGRNQNAYAEVNLDLLHADEGHLARRPSGGGAVYHDLGNLNFTFITPKEAFDVPRQMQVLLHAVQAFGIAAAFSGRNDVLADGRKFSGNAYYRASENAMHHGTILVDTDSAVMGKYLNVSHAKLAAKGVSSVRSRVVSLRELAPDISVHAMKAAMEEAFAHTYGGMPKRLGEGLIDWAKVDNEARRISRDAYVLGERIPFTLERRARFPWGDIWVQLMVQGGRIVQARCYSDAMEQDIIENIEAALTGIHQADCAAALAALGTQIALDVRALLEGMHDGL